MDHIMFGGGPGVFLHSMAGVRETTWAGDAEDKPRFRLGAQSAAAVGGAEIWTMGPHGSEAALAWRIAKSVDLAAADDAYIGSVGLVDFHDANCQPGRSVLLVQAHRTGGRGSGWDLVVPVELLAVRGELQDVDWSVSVGQREVGGRFAMAGHLHGCKSGQSYGDGSRSSVSASGCDWTWHPAPTPNFLAAAEGTHSSNAPI